MAGGVRERLSGSRSDFGLGGNSSGTEIGDMRGLVAWSVERSGARRAAGSVSQT